MSASGIGALAVVLVTGGGLVLLLGVDDARRSFPQLEVQAPAPPEDQNGYLLMEQMRARWPLKDDEQFGTVMGGSPGGVAAPAPGWAEQAGAVVQRYPDCLAAARELVAKPHCLDVQQVQGMAWADRNWDWLAYARTLSGLLVVSAQLDAAQNNWRAALDEADRVVRLGLLVSKESTSLIQTLVGMAVTQRGLGTLQSLAARAPDASLLKAYLQPPVAEEDFRKGFNLGFAGEFQGSMGMLEDLRTGGMERYGTLDGNPPGFWERQVRVIPLIKSNMTYDLFGSLLSQYIVRTDTYAPPPKVPYAEVPGLRGIGRTFGWLHFARNPIGDILIAMLMPAMDRAVQEHFRGIAGMRLTQLFLALRCYQLEHGKLPETLDALAPEYLKTIPLDPFTGKPFGYEPGGQRPRIWSVGPDQVPGKSFEEGGDDVVVELGFAHPPAAK